jgi:hypothetical protein
MVHPAEFTLPSGYPNNNQLNQLKTLIRIIRNEGGNINMTSIEYNNFSGGIIVPIGKINSDWDQTKAPPTTEIPNSEETADEETSEKSENLDSDSSGDLFTIATYQSSPLIDSATSSDDTQSELSPPGGGKNMGVIFIWKTDTFLAGKGGKKLSKTAYIVIGAAGGGAFLIGAAAAIIIAKKVKSKKKVTPNTEAQETPSETFENRIEQQQQS